jgi:hypothetical protein
MGPTQPLIEVVLWVLSLRVKQSERESENSHPSNADYDGFGGLVIRMLASGSRVRGFKPSRNRWILLYIKILSMPSFGGEVK